MPFRDIKPGSFNLDTLKLMQSAFDEVCEKIPLQPDDPRRTKLATVIVELVGSGELDGLADKARRKV